MAVASRSQYLCRVAANQPLCREHYRLLLSLDEFPPTQPGQFIQVAGRDMEIDDTPDSPHSPLEWNPPAPPRLTGRELTHPTPLLRRPFSLAGRRDTPHGVELDLIHRAVGLATDWLSHLAAGDTVSILGPLGNHFELPPPARPAILIGGGVGIPPMLYLATQLSRHPAVAICGATARDLLPLTITAEPSPIQPLLCISEFAIHNIPTLLTTDDGSIGFKGYVTGALEAYLDGGAAGANPILYTCGPEPMMKRVAEIALRRGLDCQVAVERAMACGMGTCQSCCIKVRASNRPDGRTWLYKLACTDGPIFPAAQLLW